MSDPTSHPGPSASTTQNQSASNPAGPRSALRQELDAIDAITGALESLDAEARQRTIAFVLDRLGLTMTANGERMSGRERRANAAEEPDEQGQEADEQFEDVAALYDAANPGPDTERAIVVAYWYQVISKQPDFGAQQINDSLKNLGHGITNITETLDRLKARKPNYVRQLQKSGSSKQARKRYRLTDAGVRAVRDMIAGKQHSED
jgi:hypothetical protein